jgi:hypothetical protein
LSRRIVDALACNVITRKHALVIYRSDLVAICVDGIIVAKQNASSSLIHALRRVPVQLRKSHNHFHHRLNLPPKSMGSVSKLRHYPHRNR